MSHRPSLKTNPDGWEHAWQSDLDRKFPSYRKRMPSMVSDLRPLGSMAVKDASSRQNAADRINQLCELQTDLTKMAGEKCAAEGFEEEWKRCAPKDRKGHYLTAMTQVCEIPDMEDQRIYAPDITLKAFEVGGGQGYLDILRKLLVPQSFDGFVHLKNSLIESMLGIEPPLDTSNRQSTDPMVFIQRVFITNRTLFITLVVWNILLSFYGKVETLVPLKNSKGKKLTQEELKEMKNLGLTSDTIESAQKESKAERKNANSICKHCGKLEIELGNTQFKSCSKCVAAGGYTKYCGRECQVADWKTGKPPHKTICGKPEGFLEVQAEGPDTPKGKCNPPAPGFQRSPALLHQLRTLDENPTLDYVLMRPYPHEDHGVILPNPMGKVLFTVNLNRAVTSGDKAAVKSIYDILAPTAGSLESVGLEGLRKQLLNEYGVDVTKAI